MEPGKLWTPILKRSVHNIINYESSKSAAKLHTGEDAADFILDGSYMLAATAVREGIDPQLAYYAVNNAFNNIYAAHGIPSSIVMTLNLRKCEEEKVLKQWIRNINNTCKEESVKVLGGHTCVSPDNEHSVLSITALGRKRNPFNFIQIKKGSSYDGFRVIVTKYAGLEGTALLIDKYFGLLEKIYTSDFLSSINCYNKLSIKEESDIIWKYINECSGAAVKLHDISEGGIMAALWELAESISCGLEIELEKIPLKQITIEVCEALDINPYMLKTCGSLLIVTDRADELLPLLNEQGIQAADIGRVTKGNKRIFINKEEIRFIEPFRGDSMYLAKH